MRYISADLSPPTENASVGLTEQREFRQTFPIKPAHQPVSLLPSRRMTPDYNLAPNKREQRLLLQLVLLVLVLAAIWALSLNLVDPDLWGHVRYGQDLLATGQLPQTATHTFTATDTPWINHEHLAELSFATGYRYLGTSGLLIAKSLAGLGILLIMAWTARRQGVHPLAAWIAMLLVAANLHPFFLLRPQLFSFALCTLVLLLISTAFRDWQKNQTLCWQPLAILPFVFAIWANTHGAFAAGLCIVSVYLVGRTIEIFTQMPPSRSWKATVLKASLLIGITLACLTATLANPYGANLHHWLLQSLSQPRPEITEWAAPSPQHIVFWPWIALLATTWLSLLFTRQRRDWLQITILALVAWQSALHMRHIAFLALLCGFWLPVHLQSAVSRVRFNFTLSHGFRRAALVAMLFCTGGLSFAIDQQLKTFPVSRNAYPLDAVQFMVDRGLQGKLVVSFNWAQYAVAALAPEVQVGFDGRFRTCYPQEVVDMHFDFLLGEFGGQRSRSPNSGPIDPARVLEHGLPDLVLLDRRYANAANTMQQNPDWVLLFRDRVAEIWGRSQRYNDPHSEHFFATVLRVQDPRSRFGTVPWPALPQHDDPKTVSLAMSVATSPTND